MNTPQDPEQLLAQALRAQAARAPHDERASDSGEHAVESASLAAEPGEVPTPPAWPGEQPPAEASRSGSTDFAYPQADAASGIAPGTPSGYGLLSGTGASSLEAERAALDGGPAVSPAPPAPAPLTSPAPQEPTPGNSGPRRDADGASPAPATGPLPARWVLLLAVLLGLAAGSVVGMLTLL